MININYQGRFGNNLFQYAAAILFSLKFNQSIFNPLDNKIFKFSADNENFRYENDLIVDDNNFFEAFNLPILNKNIILNGFFQNRIVLEFLNTNRHLLVNEFGLRHGTFVHVRLGDILNDNYSCKIDYYQKALHGISGGYISSDSPSHDIIKKLSNEFDLKIFENSSEETIIFGCQFENKILSLGTFSWWIGFLGNQNNTICPIQKEYRQWHGDIFPFLNWREVSSNN